MNPWRFAALFVDFENLYYFLRERLTNGQDASDAVTRMIRTLRIRLQQDRAEECIVQHAYADFDRIEESAQSALYLLGVESHHVVATEHKNAADMQLCIEAISTLYTRPEIETFVFMGGDRDYIPVIQHLRKHAKTIRVASFIGNTSGDLLQVAGEENFLDAAGLLPSAFKIVEKRPEVKPPENALEISLPNPVATAVSKQLVTRFAKAQKLSDPARTALQSMLENFCSKPEIWMTPYLHRLREEMPLLAEYERKALITDLDEAGAIAVEKRSSSTRDYSVIVVNWSHPEVRELNPGE